MEQQLRLLLTNNSKPSEQSLLNVFNKLSSPNGNNFSSDLFILLAERFFDLQLPLQKHIIDKAESMIMTYNRLQEPPNQFQIRAQICQALIYNWRAQQQRGELATSLNEKAIEYIYRAMRGIQATSLYNPLALKAVFVFYNVAFPFFPVEYRSHIASPALLALHLLEIHLTDKFDSTLRLYISLSLLNGCIYDDQNKADDAIKVISKLFTMIPAENVLLKFSLLKIMAHFSRKNVGYISKMKFEINEQLQKASIMYQICRSNSSNAHKDLPEAFKICVSCLDGSKRDNQEECASFEILIGEIGRLAASLQLKPLALECHQRASGANSKLARLNASLITSELALSQEMSPDERAEIISNMAYTMSLAQSHGDLVLVQDAATLLWNHSLMIIHKPGLIKRHLLSALEILGRLNIQANLLRAQMHFAAAKFLEQDGDYSRSLDQLRRALQLDYLISDHPSTCQRPFDRYLVPFYKMLNVQLDAYGQHVNQLDSAYSFIASHKKVNTDSIMQTYNLLLAFSDTDVQAFNPIDAAHFCSVWAELIKITMTCSNFSVSVDACKKLLEYAFDPITHDSAVEIQCEATVHGIQSAFEHSEPRVEDAISFLKFSIAKSKVLKLPRLQINSIISIWNSFFSKRNPSESVDYHDLLGDCVNALFEADFEPANTVIGQITNYYVAILLELSEEPPVSASQQKGKKLASMDPQKQKQIKTAEDVSLRSLPLIKSVYEKKALVDKIVEIFGRRGALPPNQADQEASMLLQLATIMNDKVQHKNEVLTQIFNQMQSQNSLAIYALISEKAVKLDCNQLAIDSATRMIENSQNLATKDELYHLALAYFNRGMSYLKQIQPDLQDFSCQDKLRYNSASDFHKASLYFWKSQNKPNSEISLAYFCSTIAAGENFPKFRSYLFKLLEEAIDLIKKVTVSDEHKVGLYRVYLKVLIDSEEFDKGKKVLRDAMTSLKRDVHKHLWDLNLVITLKHDCSKNQIPLVDEMLRVKQLGDAKYQSQFWSFVADISTDMEIQYKSLKKAVDVLPDTEVTDKFIASTNLAKWMTVNNFKWSDVEAVFNSSINFANTEIDPSTRLRVQFSVEFFILTYTNNLERFKQAVNNIICIGDELYYCISEMNRSPNLEEEVAQGKMTTKGSSRAKNRVSTKENDVNPDFATKPTTFDKWHSIMRNIDKHKCPTFSQPFEFAQQLIDAADILKDVGREFQALCFWYISMLVTKNFVNSPRFEQLLYIKFKVFADRLNMVSQLEYSTDFSITEAEKSEWTQKVGRYQFEPPSSVPSLRSLLNAQAEVLVDLGDYRNTLIVANSALSQAEQLNDNDASALSRVYLAIVEVRSSNISKAADLLKEAADQAIGLSHLFWIKWFNAAAMVHKENGRSGYVSALLHKFCNTVMNGSLSTLEIIRSYNFFTNSAEFLDPGDAVEFYKEINPILIDPYTFMPSVDFRLAINQRMLLSDIFASSVVEFNDFGRDILKRIESAEKEYSHMLEICEEAAVPWLIRYVESVNLFGELIIQCYANLKESHEKSLEQEKNKASPSKGSFSSQQTLLAELTPSAAILQFNSVQCLSNIPKKYAARLNVFMGQTLHAFANDNVTLQNSVKSLWKSVPQLIELQMFEHAGDIAYEIYEILRSSDPAGSIHMFLIAQNAIAYGTRVKCLVKEAPPNNRELLFIEENSRLSKRFMNPTISQMFNNTQKFFTIAPYGTTLLSKWVGIEEVKALSQEFGGMMYLIIEKMDSYETMTSTLIYFTPEENIIHSTVINLDLDLVSTKTELFSHILSSSSSNNLSGINSGKRDSSRGKDKKAKEKVKDKSKDKPANSPHGDSMNPPSDNARNALKTSNPEFTSYIDELTQCFAVTMESLPENIPNNLMVVSSNRTVHLIPFEFMGSFQKFTTIYHDFSVFCAISRKDANNGCLLTSIQSSTDK